MTPCYQDKWITIHHGDCREVLPSLADCSIDSVVTDPPYHLTQNKKGGSGQASVNLSTPQGRARITTGFMGKAWDGGEVAHDPSVWSECLRVLKPGGHLLAFGGSRTYHRLACAIEDAGFEIRDQIQWIYGSGFPKSLDVSKAIDAAAGAERASVGIVDRRTQLDGSIRSPSSSEPHSAGYGSIVGGRAVDVTLPKTDAAKQWDGWGTALKPAHEPIVLARKPLCGTVAENVLRYGTGGLNIDGCRIARTGAHAGEAYGNNGNVRYSGGEVAPVNHLGRWPANVIHDGSEEVLAGFPDAPSRGFYTNSTNDPQTAKQIFGSAIGTNDRNNTYAGDSGSAARFFYCAKASKEDREEGLHDLPIRTAGQVTDRKDGSDGLNSPRAGAGRTSGSRNFHPTVKPTDLMRYLVRLVTPPNGITLDPFCGSGSTGKAAALEEFRSILIDLDIQHCELAANRAPLVQESFFSQ